MKHYFSYLSILCAIFLAIIGQHCTNNPISDDKSIASRKTITGEVKFNTVPDQEESSPSGVYIWLEKLNQGTFTNADGKFSFTLPAPENQPDGGLTGAFHLYVYMGNFKIANANVFLHDGKFLFSQGDLDEFGKLQNPIILEQLVAIHTRVEPTNFSTNKDNRLDVFVTLHTGDEFVGISATGAGERFISSSIFISKQDSNRQRLKTLSNSANLTTQVIGGTIGRTHHFHSSFELPANFLGEGNYKVIPYLWVVQDSLPTELIESLAAPYLKFDEGYLNIPYKREPGNFTITVPKDTSS